MAETLLSAQDHFVFAPGIKKDGGCQPYAWFWAVLGGTHAQCRFFSPGSTNLFYRPWFAFSFSFDNKPGARNPTETLRSQGHRRATGWEELDTQSPFEGETSAESPAYKHSHGNLQK